MLIAVAALALRQIDMYPPTYDEFYSMFNSGWIVNSPYSPIEVLQSLVRNSANHTPLYFLLLNLWGHLVGNAVAMGRTLTIFAGLLSLAITYRLARDIVAPIAGLFAIILLASNAFYNYFYAHARMYPLLMLASAIVIWLYLRIICRQKTAKRKDYLLLGASCYLLANTHAFSVLLFVTIGAYHLLFVAKDKRWLRVSIAVVLALLLFSPWIVVLVTLGIDRTFMFWARGTTTVEDILMTWLLVSFNGNLALPALAAIGAWIGIRDKTVSLRVPVRLLMLFLTTLGLVALVSNSLQLSSMRLTLPGLPLVLLFVATSLYALYRVRKALGLLALVWVIAGVNFQQSANMQTYLAGRATNFQVPAWHAVSRLATKSEQQPLILGYGFNTHMLFADSQLGYAQYEFYFGNQNLELITTQGLAYFEVEARQASIAEPSIWVVYRADTVDSDRVGELTTVMESLNYDSCAVEEVAYGTVVVQFQWNTLECGKPGLLASYLTDPLGYELYGLSFSAEGEQIWFVDRWASRNDFAVENYQISHQLLNDDWQMVVQLDVPLVHEDKLRRFWIDVSDVPPGTYRLMAIIYNAQTGERVPWIDNPGYVPEMLELGEVVLD